MRRPRVRGTRYPAMRDGKDLSKQKKKEIQWATHPLLPPSKHDFLHTNASLIPKLPLSIPSLRTPPLLSQNPQLHDPKCASGWGACAYRFCHWRSPGGKPVERHHSPPTRGNLVPLEPGIRAVTGLAMLNAPNDVKLVANVVVGLQKHYCLPGCVQTSRVGLKNRRVWHSF